MENHQTDKACIEACLKCAATCDHCASSCLKEEDVKMMARCIQMDLECATVCNAAARLMSLGSKMAPEICALCATMCEACGAECPSMTTTIAASAQLRVTRVRKSAVRWQLKQSPQASSF